METVKWKPVIGYEGWYEVSNTGRVRSVDRVVKLSGGRERRLVGKLVGIHKDRDGRIYVALYKNGLSSTFRVHTLVLSTFISIKPEGMECCHNDGNPLNNDISNLRWDTRSNNQLDRRLHGTVPEMKGFKGTHVKFKECEVWMIKKLLHFGIRNHILTKMFSTSASQIYMIAHGKTWINVNYSLRF